MNKQDFRKFTDKNIVFLDGATGSNLMKRGMPGGVCPEEWILEHPEILIGLQKEYVDAGTNILYAPTFTANRIKLAEYQLEDQIQEINRKLVQCSMEAAKYGASIGKRVLIAGDLTMTGVQLTPIGTMDFEDLITVYKEQISCLYDAGVDLLIVETMMSLQECRAALIAAKETAPDLPVMVTMTFENDGRTLYGTDAKTAAIVLESLGADAIGANCSTGPDQMAKIIHEMASVTTVPVIAKPNAGLPSLDEDGNTVYKMSPLEFGKEAELVWEAGASILGGCCGTTPDHIKALFDHFHTGKNAAAVRKQPQKRFLTSERKTVEFDLNSPFLIIGERINPTGKKKLQAELKEGSTDLVLKYAEDQESAGASVLDVNMGMSGINETEMMLRVIEEISEVSQLPLCLDSSSVETLEAALRKYPGRALVNSVSYESGKMENLLPLVQKYGAMFILLPLSDQGLPKSLEEKKTIIDAIQKHAISVGLKKEDIIVDGLVTTVSANPNAALETLDTIRFCKEKGLATVVGLSNISFGLPERTYINTAFLTMAISAGLTMAIANPSQDMLTAAALSSDLLLHKEDSDLRYIQYMNRKNSSEDCTVTAAPQKNNTDLIYNAVLKGNRKGIAEYTEQALKDGISAEIILNHYLLPAIDEVGKLFDCGKYFLPQLIASAETMKNAISILEPLLKRSSDHQKMPTIVVATVKGDIHDIGKNLVVMMLKNHGFRVIDLGKDVDAELIVRTAKEENAALIGLSALMTTTMQEMKHVVELARKEYPEVKIMIGGAVVTQDYADEIHADAYSEDAADAVKVAKRLLNL